MSRIISDLTAAHRVLRGLVITAFVITSGCQFLDRAPAKPIGYSKDENGRSCTTYETGSKRVYQTVCDYGGQYPASVNNPLSK
jgi:hypothetical protein